MRIQANKRIMPERIPSKVLTLTSLEVSLEVLILEVVVSLGVSILVEGISILNSILDNVSLFGIVCDDWVFIWRCLALNVFLYVIVIWR